MLDRARRGHAAKKSDNSAFLRFMLRSHAGTGWKQLFPEWKQ
jgi:hypothetical protein